MELKINKKYIHSLEDFIKKISEENKDIDAHKSDETKNYESALIYQYMLFEYLYHLLIFSSK